MNSTAVLELRLSSSFQRRQAKGVTKQMASSRILITEDEGIVALDLQCTLEGMGYSVVAVASAGEEAIEKAEKTQPDLVLMDIVLAGAMDGVEAAEQIHDQLHIPVIFLTAYADDHILERAKRAEPYGYIIKPFKEDLEIWPETSILPKPSFS